MFYTQTVRWHTRIYSIDNVTHEHIHSNILMKYSDRKPDSVFKGHMVTILVKI